eukprot:CAMPEP_0202340360 /NCGR_PEP_ID=MMETSP1126-20121109/1831_1 /ASSEMBLY_ACC=CAM_ASM_000457 /TAXON_ID=3047 /ORGANISM="Dunaliella tertiolecta, Strain CCMP1320" /LENGTH=179 /DNA_ID=CAMNT_0048931051 /DNA_START=1445 /DNA_END=1983 /DNA_ORIENTATION=+
MTPGLENRLFPGLVTSPFVNTRSSRDPAGGGSLSRASGRAALSPAAPASPLPRNGVSASPPRPPNRSKRRALALSFTLWLLMFVSMPLLRALWLHVSPWSGHAAVFVPLLPMSWLTIPSLPEPVPKANELRVPWVGLLAAATARAQVTPAADASAAAGAAAGNWAGAARSMPAAGQAAV